MGDRLRLPPARGLRWLGLITVVAALGTAFAFALDAGPHTSEAHVPGGDDPALVARCARLLAERHGIVCTGLEQADSGQAHG